MFPLSIFALVDISWHLNFKPREPNLSINFIIVELGAKSLNILWIVLLDQRSDWSVKNFLFKGTVRFISSDSLHFCNWTFCPLISIRKLSIFKQKSRIFSQLLLSWRFTGSIVNRKSTFLNGGSLKITWIVPLIICFIYLPITKHLKKKWRSPKTVNIYIICATNKMIH